MIITLHLGWLPQDFLESGHLLVPIPSCVIGSADGDDSAIPAKWFMISSHDLVDHNCKENQTVLLSNAPTHMSPHYCKWHNIFGFTALNCIRHDWTDNIRRQRNLITLSFHRELHKHKPTSSLMRMSYDFSLSVLYRLYPVGAQFSNVFIPGFFPKFPTFDRKVGLASEKYFNIFSQHCHSSDLTWLKKISSFPNDFQFFCPTSWLEKCQTKR